MKLLPSLFFTASLLFFGVGCDRHPAEQTIPGYRANDHPLDDQETLVPTAHPVKFFSDKVIPPLQKI